MSDLSPPVRPISAVLITRNGDRKLADVLAALTWCDEILVVDSGSTDQTLAIAERFGCRIVHQPFLGFGPQKRVAVAHARHDWVFSVDSDEVVTPDLQREIQALLRQPTLAAGYSVPISLVFLGRLMRGGESKSPHRRLFDRRRANFNANLVHEKVELPDPVPCLKNQMLHYSYGSLADYLDKFNRYTTAGATDMYQKGRKAPLWQIVLRFPVSFLREYVIKRNVLNGYPGFLWSLLSAMYPVVKYAKLRELHAAQKNLDLVNAP